MTYNLSGSVVSSRPAIRQSGARSVRACIATLQPDAVLPPC